MVQIEMNKPSACRWTDEEGSIHLCPFLDSEYECILQGRIGYWSWGGQYKNCPLHEVTDTDTVSGQNTLSYMQGYVDGCRQGRKDAEWALTALTQSIMHGQWIPCSERLPEQDERVLVAIDDYDYFVWDCMSNRGDDYFWEDEHGFYHNKYEVLAWMPLPKLLEGKDEP